MFVAAAVLSRDGLQSLARMIFVFAQPIYDSHSTHAATVRGPEASLAYYTKAAQGAWLATLGA
eukprot:4536773-Lingulodinium_polyedra.AAC.1